MAWWTLCYELERIWKLQFLISCISQLSCKDRGKSKIKLIYLIFKAEIWTQDLQNGNQKLYSLEDNIRKQTEQVTAKYQDIMVISVNQALGERNVYVTWYSDLDS
jgi:hypothetical protein